MKKWIVLSKKWIVLSVILVALSVAACLPTLLLPREQAGQFGDSFGFINSIASGLALLAIIWTVIRQEHEIASATSAQARQLDVAQKTARIQALTYLAEWHYRMMRDSPGDSQEMNKDKSAFFGNRAIAILGELGEELPSELSAVNVRTARQDAVDELKRIVSDMEAELKPHWDEPNTRGATEIIQIAHGRLEEWIAKHKDLLDVRHIRTLLGLLGDTNFHKKHTESSSAEKLYEYWQHHKGTLEELHKAIKTLSDN